MSFYAIVFETEKDGIPRRRPARDDDGLAEGAAYRADRRLLGGKCNGV